MLLKLDAKQMERVRDCLARDEDCEELGDDEYSVALPDDLEMQIALSDKGIDILAVVHLAYDKELDGWYISGQVENREEILAIAGTWKALKEA